MALRKIKEDCTCTVDGINVLTFTEGQEIDLQQNVIDILGGRSCCAESDGIDAEDLEESPPVKTKTTKKTAAK